MYWNASGKASHESRKGTISITLQGAGSTQEYLVSFDKPMFTPPTIVYSVSGSFQPTTVKSLHSGFTVSIKNTDTLNNRSGSVSWLAEASEDIIED